MHNDDELLKINAIRLVNDHKANCGGEFCRVSLMLIAVLLDRAGIKLTDDERKMFA